MQAFLRKKEKRSCSCTSVFIPQTMCFIPFSCLESPTYSTAVWQQMLLRCYSVASLTRSAITKADRTHLLQSFQDSRTMLPYCCSACTAALFKLALLSRWEAFAYGDQQSCWFPIARRRQCRMSTEPHRETVSGSAAVGSSRQPRRSTSTHSTKGATHHSDQHKTSPSFESTQTVMMLVRLDKCGQYA